jgi:hypothetical protein
MVNSQKLSLQLFGGAKLPRGDPLMLFLKIATTLQFRVVK